MNQSSYGWLSVYGGYGWLGGFGAPSLYDYGAPSGTGGNNSSTDVKLQFLLDEASGAIVDEVAAVSCAAVGTPGYSDAITGVWTNLSPGVVINANAEGFIKATSTTEARLATADAVLEAVCQFDGGGSGVHYIMSTQTSATFQDGFHYYHTPGTPSITLNIDNAGTQVDVAFTTPDLTDSVIRKHRCTMDRSGNAECFIDGTSYGTADISAMSAQSVNAAQCCIGIGPNSVNGIMGKIYEVRLTVGNLVNNSGGPGGG